MWLVMKPVARNVFFAVTILYLYSLRELPLEQIAASGHIARFFLGFIFILGFEEVSEKFSKRLEIQAPIGFKLRALAAFLSSPKVFSEVLEPPLRDLYDEYCQALAEKRFWKARWVRLRGYWSFWAAFFAQTPISLAKKVYQIWKAIP